MCYYVLVLWVTMFYCVLFCFVGCLIMLPLFLYDCKLYLVANGPESKELLILVVSLVHINCVVINETAHLVTQNSHFD